MNWFESILDVYGNVLHPPLVLVLCISGTVGHLLTMAALFSMCNPTNVFLISMSFCQLLLCLNFLYSTFFKWASDQLCSPLFFSYWMVRTMHASVTLSVLVHMAGVFHVVALSFIRYFSLAKLLQSTSNASWFTYKKFWISIFIIFVSVGILGTPLYFTSNVIQVAENEGCAVRFPSLHNMAAYQLQFASHPSWLKNLNFWLFNSCAKIIPAAILSIMSLLIVKQLKQLNAMSSRFVSERRDKQHRRTTKLILAIMLAFILIELPQGILAVLATISNVQIFFVLGDFIEMVTLLNSCIIFALFCVMNGRVRNRLAKLPVVRPICQVVGIMFEEKMASRKQKKSLKKKCGQGPTFTAL